MKLSEIIAKIDLTDISTSADYSDISQLFGISEWSDKSDADNEWERRTREHYIETWLCTDTWVGVSIIFLDAIPIAVTQQPARKSDTIYKWISKEAHDKMREFVLSLVKTEVPKIDLMNLDEEWGDGYHIKYDTQIVFEKGTYSGEPVTVKHWCWYEINTLEDPSYLKVEMDESVVDFENGDRKVVKTSDILFPYLTQDHSKYRN